LTQNYFPTYDYLRLAMGNAADLDFRRLSSLAGECRDWPFLRTSCAGAEAHLAEPADTAAARGPKRRAKTDRADARLLRDLLADGRLPESWIPPQQVLEMRARLQLFKDLREQHTGWVQRIHAILLHHGVPAVTGGLLSLDNRRRLETGEGLSPAGRQAVDTALRIIDALDAELDPLRKQIAAFADRQPGCRALQADYGIGPITAAALWSELGDSARFSTSLKAVRHTGLDITVHSSDGKRSAAHLSRQGSPLLRWALFEAAQCAARPGSPRLRLLPAGRRPDRRRTSHPLGGPQDGPPRPPHPARPRRPGPRPRLNPGPESEGTRCAHLPTHRCPRPAPARSAADRALSTKRPGKTERPPVPRDTPEIIMSPQPPRP
jgi:transposase